MASSPSFRENVNNERKLARQANVELGHRTEVGTQARPEETSNRPRWRPSRPLPERPPVSRSRGHIRSSNVNRRRIQQPFVGLAGLPIAMALLAVLLFAYGNPATTQRVFGVLSLYALPGAVVIALWWEDWPGSKMRPWWSGLVDTTLIAASGIAFALLAQMVIQGELDPPRLMGGTINPPHGSPSPSLLPLGIAVFTVMLQLTLVTEGWPLRRLGRVKGGLAALGISWIAGFVIEQGLVGTGAVEGEKFAAVLAFVAAIQVIGWVVLRGASTAWIPTRAVRLVAGNLATICLGWGAYVLLRLVVNNDVVVSALGASVVGAGLVVGMLFEGWPIDRLPSVAGHLCAVAETIALALVSFGVSTALAGTFGIPFTDVAGWSVYALNSVATATIIHVGVFRRWPVANSSVQGEAPADHAGT